MEIKTRSDIRNEIMEIYKGTCTIKELQDEMYDLLTDLNYDDLNEKQIKKFIMIFRNYIYEFE